MNSHEGLYVTMTFLFSLFSALIFYFFLSPNPVVFTIVITKIIEVFIVILRPQ